MKRVFAISILVSLFAICASAQATAFTYQGKLTDGSVAANGTYQMQFSLHSASSGMGNQVGATITNDSVSVASGIFTVQLDFTVANAFDGSARWLEIAVRKLTDPPGFTTLSPRQPITSSPYSIRTLSASSSDSLSVACLLCVQDSHINSVSGSKVTGTVASATTAATAGNVTGIVQIANGGTGSATQNFVDLTTDQTVAGTKTFSGTLSGNGSGLTNLVGTMRWQVVSGTFQQAQSNNGYVATDPGQVTITLPTAPNVGDVVRVSGIGAGGWKIAQNVGQSVLGANLGLAGSNWTARDANRNWFSIASSADGSKLAAVVYPGQIYTSADSGATWTPRETNRDWNSIASSADGTKLAAVVFGGRIYTSADSGANWTPRETNRNWPSIASSADGTKLAAVANGGQIYTSTNSGVTWTPRDVNRAWWSIASSADGSKLVAVVYGGQIFISTDSGATWSPRDLNRNWSSVASSADGSRMAAVEYFGHIYTSTDSGASWTPRMTDASRFWLSIASSADGTKLVAVMNGGPIYTSTDSGGIWTPRDTTRNWQSIASSADGFRLAAVVNGGRIYTSSPNTTPGTAGYLSGSQGTAIELQYIGNGQFLPLSHEGTMTAF